MSVPQADVRAFLDEWARTHPNGTAKDAADALRVFLDESDSAPPSNGRHAPEAIPIPRAIRRMHTWNREHRNVRWPS